MPSTEAGGGGGGGGGGAASSSTEGQTAYNDLKRLIPSLAAELELLRTSLREHSLWLLRYGHGNSVPAPQAQAQAQAQAQVATPSAPSVPDAGHPPPPPPHPSSSSSSSSTAAATGAHNNETTNTSSSSHPPTGPPPSFTEASEPLLPPAYSASDVPPYTGGFSTVSAATREDVRARRDQLTEWLREGEDVLREYSARYAQLAQELGMPQEDLLGTWHEAHPDNALPGYRQVEEREELMVGGVGEVPPPYLGGRIMGTGSGTGAGAGTGAGTGGRGSSGAGGSGDPSASSSSTSKQESGGE